LTRQDSKILYAFDYNELLPNINKRGYG